MSHYRNAAEIPIILVGTQGEFFAFRVELKTTFRDGGYIRRL